MKEITSTYGGRYRYNEDIRVLQESALALTEFLGQFPGNYVISGCKNNSGGYAWIDGKIRHVDEADINTSYNYIVAKDSNNTTIVYYDGTEHEILLDYSAEYSASKPSDGTGYIELVDGSFQSISSEFFDKFGVSKTVSSKTSVTSPLRFLGDTRATSPVLGDIVCGTGDDCIRFTTGKHTFELGVSLSDPYIRCLDDSNTVIWQAGINDSASGDMELQPLSGNKLTVRNKIYCYDLLIKTKSGKYVSIKDIDKYAITTVNKYQLYNTYDKSNDPYLFVCESNNKVNIYGVLTNKYFDENEHSDCHDNYIVFSDTNYHKVVSCEKIDGEMYRVVMKLSLMIPSSIKFPTNGRLPGCMLSGNMSTRTMGAAASYNAQLMVGSDGYLYIIAYSKNTTQLPININGGIMYGMLQTPSFTVNLTYAI